MTAVVGRDRELGKIARFLDLADGAPRVLLVEGEAGIGKTTLWRAGVDAARDLGYSVLACAGAEAETQLSFTALRDLVGEVFDDVADELPSPQRSVMAVVLLRAEPTGLPPNPGTIAVAFLSTLRALATRAPTLLAVDDVQWLDHASAAPLGFALRRLDAEPLAVLLSRRTQEGPEPLALDRLDRERLQVLEVDPLTVGALGHILHARLGLTYPRPTLTRLHEVSGGNPFFALELARALGDPARPLAPGAALPVPQTLRELVSKRLTTLPGRTLQVLTFASALSRPTLAVVGAALGLDALPLLDPAIDAQVADVDGETIRFAHPFFAAAVYGLASAARRRETHRRLAEVVTDAEERARHLALAVEAPDVAVAAALDEAARGAFARGAIESAAALGEQALRFTDEAQLDALQRRRLAAAGYLARAGPKARARELLDAARADAPPGPERAQIALGLAWWGLADDRTRIEVLGQAVEDARDDARLLAQVHTLLGALLFPKIDMASAERHAGLALELAERTGDPATLVLALTLAENIDFHAGRGIDVARVERAIALEAVGANPWGDIGVARFVRGLQLLAIGELDAARRSFEVLAAEGRSRADAGLADFLMHLAEVEILAGNWQRAQELADEATELAREVDDQAQQAKCHHTLTLLATLRGDPGAARTLGANGLWLADQFGNMLVKARISAALGLLELSLGNGAAARSHLDHTARLVAKIRAGEPGIVPFVPDLVEALVTVGELEAAETATAELEEQGRRLARRFALAGAARCRGLIAAARGDLVDAVDQLEAARDEAALVGQPFELARTLLALGVVRRRARQKRQARETLQEALAIFEELGAELWAEQARTELARIGGRSQSSDGLTASEQRIAELVAEGKTNKEVAAILVVADRTVESALTQIYRKLDVRSRTELARKLAGQA